MRAKADEEVLRHLVCALSDLVRFQEDAQGAVAKPGQQREDGFWASRNPKP